MPPVRFRSVPDSIRASNAPSDSSERAIVTDVAMDPTMTGGDVADGGGGGGGDREILVERDVLQQSTSAAAAAAVLDLPSQFPNQMANTGYYSAESSQAPAAAAAVTPSDQQEMTPPSSTPSKRSSTVSDGDAAPAFQSIRRRHSGGGEEGEASPPAPAGDCFGDLNLQWEVNYKEAAIFLEEGLNNDKFTHHPRSREALPAYLLVHNTWFHVFDVGAALVLLALGFFEAPCKSLCVPEQVHSSVEIAALVLVAAQVFLKTRWIGWRTFFRHKRTLIKAVALAVMLVEALVVLIRSDNHFRVTRALRPIFLIDNHFFGGVRRY